MIAAEAGNLKALNYFLKLNFFSMTYSVNSMSAIDYAYKNRNFEIVLKLLKLNSPFPKDFDPKIASQELRIFADLMNQMHDEILSENNEKVLEIIQKNSNLRYFYNTKNISALSVATREAKFEVYELLIVKNLLYGSKENYQELIAELTQESCEELRLINFKNSRNFTDRHVMKLVANSTIGDRENLSDEGEHQKFKTLLYFKNFKF